MFIGLAGMLTVMTACAGRANAPEAPPRAQTQIKEAAAATAEAVDRILVQSGFQGAFLVAVEARVFLSRGYGYRDRNRTLPVTVGTAFWTASVAKNFTAAAIMRLVETGKLRLSDPVGTHLGGVPETWRGMTIAHLLNHTSGIKQNYAADGIADRVTALKAIGARRLESSPGHGWSYSNDAYSVLAMVIEVTSGQTYEEFLRHELFDRAGLTHTGFWSAPPALLAELVDPASDRRRVAHWGLRGGSGIATSAEDLHRWWLALQAGSVLKPQSVAAMLSPSVWVNEELSTGYGWFQERSGHGRRVVWTRGTDQSGENASLYALPELGLVSVALSHHEGDKDPVTRRLVVRSIEIFEDALDGR